MDHIRIVFLWRQAHYGLPNFYYFFFQKLLCDQLSARGVMNGQKDAWPLPLKGKLDLIVQAVDAFHEGLAVKAFILKRSFVTCCFFHFFPSILIQDPIKNEWPLWAAND